MRAKIWGLWEEERGVAAVLGAMLMLLIMVTAYGVVQAYHVPIWNKDVEFEHLNVVYDDMMTFKSDVEDVAFSGEPKSSIIRMGVRYPNRIFLANPGAGVAGALTSENVSVSIVYIIDGLGDPTITTNYTSNRITYEVQGSIDSPKLVYEHGLIIRDYGSASATTDEQSLVVGDEIHIPLLIGNLTAASSMETESIEIKPLSQSYSRSKIKSVEITLDTDYPEVWEQLLAEPSTEETSTASDDFESGGWTGGTGWLDNWYHSGNASVTGSGTPYEGSYHLRLRRNTGYVDRSVDLSEATSARLQFWAKANSFESGEEAYCLVSSNDTDWTTVHTWVDDVDDDDVYRFHDIDLSPYELTSEFWIAFQANMSGNQDYFYVDDLEIIYTYLTSTGIQVEVTEDQITIESTDIRQIILPTGDVTTDALYTGLATFSTESEPVTGTSVDTSHDYPSILNISIDEGDTPQTQSTITVTVKNATAPFDIHADLTGLMNNPAMYDVFPDDSSEEDYPITATSWDVPNETTVSWTNKTHPAYAGGDAVIVSFWVINTENSMQFFTERVFLRQDADLWE